VNYLAHLFLSPPGEDAMLGSLMGDFVKGPLNRDAISERYSAEMTHAIGLHRKIDSFTDSHPVVRESLGRVSKGRRRFAGVMIDMFYDHYLAKHWNDFHDKPLSEFTDDFYSILARRNPEMPERLQRISSSLIGLDWLGSYAHVQSVRGALNRISQRLRRENTLVDSADELVDNYEELELDFRRYLPDVIEFARRSASTA
jgi:acyl carrier protein phosphodiesterase